MRPGGSPHPLVPARAHSSRLARTVGTHRPETAFPLSSGMA
ncbi:hypothetical protein KCH_24050 [Kitasatospora cheerisanensis KCTC 2395]|uniref:Uncharacterized protein n=1 Tax=Kitasatospora cheerisanensis KCTC 2395 TaxID=1348663 RepID=A0A066YX11_9ACTN|nr:hypothetical protein KCH_24050 [Kitasatospora cheerisanensis KCTC 2395]